jgi:O-acetyl-ADP-ribose deacetylase (regulator of RNase III)
MAEIFLAKGDITKMDVDAIVNAANNSLLGGSGVDGAIHAAAGPELLEECKTLNGCKTGEAKITGAYNLPSDFIIHTVGPVWEGGIKNEEELLHNCYVSCLKIAAEKGFESIAFPNISTGIYGFPKELAARIALETTEEFLSEHDHPEFVYFVCFNDVNAEIYSKLMDDE